MTLRKKLEEAINSVSAENDSNTPDFILADYMMACLAAYDCATVRRDEWYGLKPAVGQVLSAARPPHYEVRSPAAHGSSEVK